MNEQQSKIFEIIFKSAISGLISFAIYLLNSFSNSLDKLQSSVNALNVNIAQVIERTVAQKEMLARFEERLRRIEEKNLKTN